MKNRLYKFFAFISEYAFYGLLFFIPISISLIEIFAGLMFFSFICRKIIKPDFTVIKFWPNTLLLLFLFFCALSLVNSGQYLSISINALFKKWAQYLCICVIIQDSVCDRKIIRRGVFVFLFSAAIVILSGLSQYFFAVEFLRHKSAIIIDNGIRALTSSFVHYNSFGGYLVVVLSLSLSLLIRDSILKPKSFVLLLFSAIATVAILLTFSRGSWLSFAASFIFLFILGDRNSWRLAPLFFAIVVVIFLFPIISDRILLIFGYGADKDRFLYWTAAFKMISAHPLLGVGLGTFMANTQGYLHGGFFYEAYAHNCYLQIWAESGILSLISFALFINAIVVLGIRSFLDSRDFLMLGLLCGVIGFLVHSFFDINLYSLQLAFLFWTWIGMIVARLHIIDK